MPGAAGDTLLSGFEESGPSKNSFFKMKLPVDLQLSSVAVREWLSNSRSKIRPWSTFGATSHFEKPSSVKTWSVRLAKNVEYFQSNYILLKMILLIYCLVTSPLLLFVLAALGGGCYIAKIRQAEKPLVIGGHPISLTQQYAGISVISIPFLFLAGAGAALMWVMVASFIIVMSHASFYTIEKVVGDDEAPFDGVLIEQV